MGVAGLMAGMVWTANGRAGMGESMVFRLRMADMRRSPLFILLYDDLLEDAECRDEVAEVKEVVANDEVAEVKEVVANDEVFVGRCSLELSDGGCVDWGLCEGGGWVSEGAEVRERVETLFVMISRVVLGSRGTLMPRSRAICRNSWSTSSSVRPFSKRSTIIR